MLDMPKNLLSFVVTEPSPDAGPFQKLYLYIMPKGNYKFVSLLSTLKQWKSSSSPKQWSLYYALKTIQSALRSKFCEIFHPFGTLHITIFNQWIFRFFWKERFIHCKISCLLNVPLYRLSQCVALSCYVGWNRRTSSYECVVSLYSVSLLNASLHFYTSFFVAHFNVFVFVSGSKQCLGWC